MPRQRSWPPIPWVAALMLATTWADPTSQPTHVFEGPTFEPTTPYSKPSTGPTAIMDQFSFAYETMMPVAVEDTGSVGSGGDASGFSYSYTEFSSTANGTAPTPAVTGAPSATVKDGDGGQTQPDDTAAPNAAPSASPTIGTSKPCTSWHSLPPPRHANTSFRFELLPLGINVRSDVSADGVAQRFPDDVAQ